MNPDTRRVLIHVGQVASITILGVLTLGTAEGRDLFDRALDARDRARTENPDPERLSQ